MVRPIALPGDRFILSSILESNGEAHIGLYSAVRNDPVGFRLALTTVIPTELVVAGSQLCKRLTWGLTKVRQAFVSRVAIFRRCPI